MAGNDVILWSVPSDSDPDDVRLRDPNATSGGSGYTLTALGGSYTITGASAVISRNRTLTASGGAYVYTGQSATISRNRNLAASGGAYTVNGAQAVLSRNRTLTATGGAYTYTGQQATITYAAGPVGYTLTALGGSYAYTGQTATILRNRSLSATGGTYAYTGAAAIISRGRNLEAQGGAYSLAGGDAVITKTTPGAYVLTALGGAYQLAGADANLTITRNSIDGGGGKSRYWQPYWMDKREWEKKIPPEAVKAIERVARSSKKGDEAERELMLELADYESRYGDMLRLLQQSQFVTLKALKAQQLAQLRLIQDEEDAEILLLLW